MTSPSERLLNAAVLIAAVLVGLSVILGGLASCRREPAPHFVLNPPADDAGLKAFWCAEYPDGGRECCYSPKCTGGGL